MSNLVHTLDQNNNSIINRWDKTPPIFCGESYAKKDERKNTKYCFLYFVISSAWHRRNVIDDIYGSLYNSHFASGSNRNYFW